MRCTYPRNTPVARFPRVLPLLFGLAMGCLAIPGALAQGDQPRPAASPASDAASSAPAGALPAAPLAPEEARRLSSQVTPPVVQPGGAPVAMPPSAERQRLGQLRQALTPSQTPEAALRIVPLEGFLDYDSEDQIIYGTGRTEIQYGHFKITADRVILDARLQEVQAEGHVVVVVDKDKLNADSLRYNFREGEGAAYNVSGSHDPVYFQSAAKKGDKKAELPQFQRLSREESIFRNTKVATCDFKVPHYSVKGREVVLYPNDRIFFRGATFYVWGVPSLYLPFFTRSMTTASPWFVQVGTGTRTGARLRLGYSYHHRTEEPSLENEEEFEIRSQGHADTYVDYLSKIGSGMGFDYNYMFEYGKHKGQLQIYGLTAHDRSVVGASPLTPDPIFESQRWRFGLLHRTQVTDNLTLLANIDEFSDPDIFYDVLDLFGNNQTRRQRQVVRSGRIVATDVEEAYVVRLMAEVKDRIGINRFNDFSDPRSDNRDFDLDPFSSLQNSNVDGISGKRWGRVTERAPQFDFATRYLPIGDRPLYYNAEAHLYNNLDKGINVVSRSDDAFVQGGQFYQSVMRQWKLSQRYTLIGKAGVGVGAAQRDNSSLGLNLGGPFPETIDNVNGLPGITFVDNNGTFLVGTKRRNLDQITPGYAWADAELDFNARFSDALTGALIWRGRTTTTDYIGDFYASIGDWLVREDLFNYPIRENWVEGNLNYRLARPLLTLYTKAGYNAIPTADLYSKEPIAYWQGGFTWSNQRQTLVLAGGPSYRVRQIYDPSVASTQENLVGANLNLSYSPIHKRWYTFIRSNYNHSLNGNVNVTNNKEVTFFTDTNANSYSSVIYGRELGPKYSTEFLAQWNNELGTLREVAWMLQRDMHDAVGILRVGMQNKDTNVASSTANNLNNLDVRFGLKFKLPNKPVAAAAAGNVKTLRDQVRQPAMSY